MRYHRTTGLMLTQIQELVRRVNEALDKPWANRVGRPKILGLYKAVAVSCQYLRQNEAQEVLGDMHDSSQPTISRYVTYLPVVRWNRERCRSRARRPVAEAERLRR